MSKKGNTAAWAEPWATRSRSEKTERPGDDPQEEPEAGSEKEPKDRSEDVPEADVEDEPEAESEDEPEAESEDEPEAESEDEPEAESEDESEADSEDEPEAESEDEPEAESEDEPEAEQEAETEAEPAAEPDAKPWEEPKAGRRPGHRPVLIAGEKSKERVADPKATGHLLLAIIGGATTLAGLITLATLWFPLGIGIPAWEFGTLSESLDALPMMGLGVALLAYGIVRHPATGPMVARGMSIAFGVLAFLLLVGGLIYARAVPSVLAEAPNLAVGTLRRSIVETVTQLTVYGATCVVVALVMWRSVRKP